jgi:hypothetical protein
VTLQRIDEDRAKVKGKPREKTRPARLPAPPARPRFATTSAVAARLSGQEAHLWNRYRTLLSEIETCAIGKGSYRPAEHGLPPDSPPASGEEANIQRASRRLNI